MRRLLQAFPVATWGVAAGLFGYSADVGLSISSTSAGIIGPKDTRMAYPDYAVSRYNGDFKAFEKFSAAGKFACGETGVSGAVVRRTNILVVAAHAVAGKDKTNTCSVHSNSGGCYFQPIKIDGSFGRKIPIRPETIKVSANYRCDDSEFDNDWALVNLAADATEVRPFAPLDAARTQPLTLVGQKILSFAAQAQNFAKPRTPTICAGILGYVWQMNSGAHPKRSYGMGINCSVGVGASGGAVLSDQESPKYLGLVSATKNDNSYDGKPFGDDNYTAGPLLYGEFYDTLMSM